MTSWMRGSYKTPPEQEQGNENKVKADDEEEQQEHPGIAAQNAAVQKEEEYSESEDEAMVDAVNQSMNLQAHAINNTLQ